MSAVYAHLRLVDVDVALTAFDPLSDTNWLDESWFHLGEFSWTSIHLTSVYPKFMSSAVQFRQDTPGILVCAHGWVIIWKWRLWRDSIR